MTTIAVTSGTVNRSGGRQGKSDKGNFVIGARVPRGLATVVEGLAREILRHQPEPEEIYRFAAQHFERLIERREEEQEAELKYAETLWSSACKAMGCSMERFDEKDKKENGGPSGESAGWSLRETAMVLRKSDRVVGSKSEVPVGKEDRQQAVSKEAEKTRINIARSRTRRSREKGTTGISISGPEAESESESEPELELKLKPHSESMLQSELETESKTESVNDIVGGQVEVELIKGAGCEDERADATSTISSNGVPKETQSSVPETNPSVNDRAIENEKRQSDQAASGIEICTQRSKEWQERRGKSRRSVETSSAESEEGKGVENEKGVEVEKKEVVEEVREGDVKRECVETKKSEKKIREQQSESPKSLSRDKVVEAGGFLPVVGLFSRSHSRTESQNGSRNGSSDSGESGKPFETAELFLPPIANDISKATERTESLTLPVLSASRSSRRTNLSETSEIDEDRNRFTDGHGRPRAAGSESASQWERVLPKNGIADAYVDSDSSSEAASNPPPSEVSVADESFEDSLNGTPGSKELSQRSDSLEARDDPDAPIDTCDIEERDDGNRVEEDREETNRPTMRSKLIEIEKFERSIERALIESQTIGSATADAAAAVEEVEEEKEEKKKDKEEQEKDEEKDENVGSAKSHTAESTTTREKRSEENGSGDPRHGGGGVPSGQGYSVAHVLTEGSPWEIPSANGDSGQLGPEETVSPQVFGEYVGPTGNVPYTFDGFRAAFGGNIPCELEEALDGAINHRDLGNIEEEEGEAPLSGEVGPLTISGEDEDIVGSDGKRVEEIESVESTNREETETRETETEPERKGEVEMEEREESSRGSKIGSDDAIEIAKAKGTTSDDAPNRHDSNGIVAIGQRENTEVTKNNECADLSEREPEREIEMEPETEPYVPELNLDSLRDATISSFKMSPCDEESSRTFLPSVPSARNEDSPMHRQADLQTEQDFSRELSSEISRGSDKSIDEIGHVSATRETNDRLACNESAKSRSSVEEEIARLLIHGSSLDFSSNDRPRPGESDRENWSANSPSLPSPSSPPSPSPSDGKVVVAKEANDSTNLFVETSFGKVTDDTAVEETGEPTIAAIPSLASEEAREARGETDSEKESRETIGGTEAISRTEKTNIPDTAVTNDSMAATTATNTRDVADDSDDAEGISGAGENATSHPQIETNRETCSIDGVSSEHSSRAAEEAVGDERAETGDRKEWTAEMQNKEKLGKMNEPGYPGVKEESIVENSLRHTGEFHDTLPLPLFDRFLPDVSDRQLDETFSSSIRGPVTPVGIVRPFGGRDFVNSMVGPDVVADHLYLTKAESTNGRSPFFPFLLSFVRIDRAAGSIGQIDTSGMVDVSEVDNASGRTQQSEDRERSPTPLDRSYRCEELREPLALPESPKSLEIEEIPRVDWDKVEDESPCPRTESSEAENVARNAVLAMTPEDAMPRTKEDRSTELSRSISLQETKRGSILMNSDGAASIGEFGSTASRPRSS